MSAPETEKSNGIEIRFVEFLRSIVPRPESNSRRSILSNRYSRSWRKRDRAGKEEGDVEEATQGDPRWNRCSLEYWKTSKRARNRGGWGAEAAQCEQATIYDAYVNSWNSGDTACSCHGVAEEKERSRAGGSSPSWEGVKRAAPS